MVIHQAEAYVYNCYGSSLYNALSHQRKERWLRFRFAELFAAMGGHCLHNTLSHHSLDNLHEASYVSTLYVVYIAVGLCTVLHAVLVDVLHNPEQLSVNFLS